MGPYRLTGRLGSGGMGQVFLGRSAGGRPVAVKVIRAELATDQEFRIRFRHEVEAARRVNGLYTAVVVDADVDGPVPWLATAYVSGPSLASVVSGHGPLPPDSVLALAAGLAESLAAIHAADVVHRDLKPANVLLADDGPRVIDFGISRATGDSVLTMTGTVVGSPAFMSPEQAEGRESGPPSDVFSLGGVLTFAASGRPPFGTGATPMVLYRVVHGTPNLDEVPAHVRPLIADCLVKDPRARPTPAEILARVGDIHPGVDWLPGPLLDAIAAERAADAPAARLAVQRTATADGMAPPTGPAVLSGSSGPLGQSGPSEPDAGPGVPGRRSRWFLATGAVAAAVAAIVITTVLVVSHGGQAPQAGTGPSAGISQSNVQTSVKSRPPPTKGHALSWTAPRSIDGAQSIKSVSCASASFCMAVTASGDAIEWNGSGWRSPARVAGSAGFNSVSCPTARFCAAITGDGSYFLWNGTSWSGPFATNTGTFEAIDCVSASFCAAVGAPEGHAGSAATWQAGVWTPGKGLYVDSMFSVSCSSPEFCLAAGDGVPVLGDETLTWAGGSWGADQLPVSGTSGTTARVSCASQGFCMLVDKDGAAAEWDGTSWLHPNTLASSGLSWVSCATARLCAAVSATGSAVLWNGSGWTNAENIDSGHAMTSVSCPTNAFCVAVDAAGNALTYR